MNNDFSPERRIRSSVGARLLLILGLALLFLVGASVLMGLVAVLLHGDATSPKAMCIMLTMQDVLVFIAPAVVAMAILYKRPLQAMSFTRAPQWQAVVLIIVAMAIALPMTNYMVEWNKQMHLPAALSDIEEWMRQSEDLVETVTNRMLEMPDLWHLTAMLFVIGLMAGLGEETLFRGGLLSAMFDSKINRHVAIWLIAALFSGIHLQFFGFVPRMLLGAWLGYLLLWTRSVWVPIIAHTLNNSLVVVFSYLEHHNYIVTNYSETIGIPKSGEMPWIAIVSALLTVIIAIAAHRYFVKKNADFY